MDELQLITTGDGSHSLLNTTLNETYHSVHGAQRESVHVFIKEGLAHWLSQNKSNDVKILEVGFGTGLNAWLTLEESRTKILGIDYTTIETFPLPEEIWKNLNYALLDEEGQAFRSLHAAPWNVPVTLSSKFTLKKVHARLQDVTLTSGFDLVYYDAFAPSKQPEMWEFTLLQKVVGLLNANGVFVTYCAKGQLKRDLATLGLYVETLPGPPGKKEMVRATKK